MNTNTSSHEALVVTRHIPATPAVVFAAWTEPDHLVRWWGPTDVVCSSAEVDLRVGGRFRIANKLPDGRTVWISGLYTEVDRPHRLRYTWVVEDAGEGDASSVTVTFNPNNGGTDVVVEHIDISSADVRDSHERGWLGCFEGLAEYAVDH